MKKLITIFIFLFSFNILADLPEVVVFVNDKPITKHEFESRKNIIATLNNIDLSESGMERKLNGSVLNILVEEELLNQYTKKHSIDIDQEDISNAISTIEQKQGMPRNSMKEYFKSKNINFDSFKKQIKGELIREQILGLLSQDISVTDDEINTELLNNNNDFNIKSWIFTAKEGDTKAKEHLQELRKKLVDCNKVNKDLFSKFAQGQQFNQLMSKFPEQEQSVITDTKVGHSSSVYKKDNLFKTILVCKKKPNLSDNELSQIKRSLLNQKLTQKAIKFMKDLKAKATIKSMIPGL